MRNTKTLWITTAATMVICAVVLICQRVGTGAVRAEIEQLENEVAAHKEMVFGAKGAIPIDSPSPVLAEKIPVEELLAMLSDDDRDIAASFNSFDSMLEHIREYSTADVLRLIDEMGALIEADKSREQKVGFPRMMLMVIVAEDAPERILELAEDANDELRSAAFAGLAKKDPQRARQYLEEVEWAAREVEGAKTVLFSELLKVDLPQALDLFRGGRWSLTRESVAAIGNACNQPKVREKLWLAAREESDPAVRLQLSKGLIMGELVTAGAGGIREAFASADFFDAKLKAELVNEYAGEAMSTEPDETVAWIREALPETDVPKALARALASWAGRDYNAAGTWLGEQAPSPERDEAIAAFANTVVRLDPEAAVTWSIEIEEVAEQKRVLTRSLRHWQEQDRAAANAWMQQNRITLESEVRAVPGG